MQTIPNTVSFPSLIPQPPTIGCEGFGDPSLETLFQGHMSGLQGQVPDWGCTKGNWLIFLSLSVSFRSSLFKNK